MSEQKIEEIFDKGDALVLEDSECKGQYLYAKDMEEIIKQSELQLDFVFMAQCHSEFAARIFLNNGTKHVIGIDKERKVSDEAVLTFTRTFYSKIWREKSKICSCFNAAKLAVEIHHSKEEASCFIKFTSDD